MLSASTLKRIAYFIISYVSMFAGVAFANLLVRPLMRLTAPFLPDEPHLFYRLSIIPICVFLLCVFYLFATSRKGIYDFARIRQFDLKRFLLLFIAGVAVVLFSLSLVMILSWLDFVYRSG